ncbi:MAG TPA: ABC transporter substrate-binding protein [Spirochaetota bacterium]|nr:ABC transporter substrate-binding protein [Spirochaetota bacterium]
MKKVPMVCLKVFVFILFFLISSCTKNGNEIIIGFAGSLSGKDYKLGVEGLNTIQLLVNETNKNGGINGKKIKLIIEDFKSDINNVVSSDKKLLDAGSIAIIGHFTSAASVGAIDFVNTNKIVLISPTSSTEELSHKDDYFFRIVMTSKYDPVYLSIHMKENSIKNIMLIKAKINESYTKTYSDVLYKEFNIVKDISYDKIDDIDLNEISMIKNKFDATVILSSAIDSGTIAQRLHIKNIDNPLYLSGWAAGDDLITYGGDSVENAILIHQVNDKLESLKDFIKKYKETYGESPSFSAIQTVHAFHLLVETIKKGGTKRKSFYESIKKIRSFNSISGIIKLDNYGDAIRTLYLKKIENGSFKVLKTIEVDEIEKLISED